MMADIRPVIQHGGGLFVDLGSDGLVEVLMGREPATLIPGWSAMFAYCRLPSFFLVELRHVSGALATWILTRAGDRIAGATKELAANQQALLRTEAQPIITAIDRALLEAGPSDAGADLNDYFLLNPAIRIDIGALCGGLQRELPKAVGEHALGMLTLPGSGVALSAAAIKRCLDNDLQKQYLDACRTGRMRWPSPVDGVTVDEVHGLLLGPLAMAWRCVDRRYNLVFFVIAGGFDQETAALYVPACDVLVVRPRTRFTQIVIEPKELMGWLAEHLAHHGQKLFAFLSAPSKHFAQYTWPHGSAHMGHYLWNELTGLERIIDGLEPGQFPLIYDLGGAGDAAFYGPLSNLFPEFGGVIRHNFTAIHEMLQSAYADGVQLVRFSGTFVSARLRKRITDAVAATGAVERPAQALKGRPGPVVVFGLRVENRTLTNLAQFYVDLGKRLLAQFGSLTVVIDGHNSRDGAKGNETFKSHLEHQATRKPIDVEREVVSAITAGLQSDRLKIVDCVGMTTFENLGWLLNADYCVAPWGAGLAKYRWICNLPSYVLVSQFCQKHKNDIRIYSDPQYMESPSQMVFSPLAIVTDRPDSTVLVEMNTPFFVNYDVDVDAVAIAVGAALPQYCVA